MHSKEALTASNDTRLDELRKSISADSIDPFALVSADLEYTKQYAIENILRTRYGELEKAAHYNLLLKGKNFRSAILFLLAKSIYYSQTNIGAKVAFEKTQFYEKVACLAACIEIAHNASLL